MVLGAASLPNEMVSSSTESAVHVRSIEVNFKAERSKHPISVKAIFGDDGSDKSKQYSGNEIVHWLFERQFESDSQFIVHVREHHSLRRTINVMTVSVSVSDLVMKPFFEISGSSTSKTSLKIHSSSRGPFIDVIRRLVQQSKNQLEAMKGFLEKLGRACEALDYLVMITEVVSSVHPAAESAATMATALLELCQKLTECHASASELMDDISTFLPFSDIPERGLKCKMTTQTTEEMLRLFESVCRAIIKYSNVSILGGLLDDRIEEILTFKEKFGKLKETFGWCLMTEIWKTTLKIEENTNTLLLQKLDPLPGSSYNENKLCFEGTRKDTLRLIREWSESESSSKLFWLSGSTGLGKTAIAHMVAKLFHDQNRLAGSFSPDDRQNSERVMPTIAYHLAKWHADYQKYILDVLRTSRETDASSGLGGQFDYLMRRPLLEIGIQSPPAHKPLIIVLDALENCYDAADCRRSFMDYVVDIANLAPWLKVFVSSRGSEDIERRFLRAKAQHLMMDDLMLDDLYHDFVACARLHAKPRDAPENWTPGMKNDIQWLLRRISKPFNTIKYAVDLESIIDSRSNEEPFCVLIQIVMEREGLNDDDIPVIRGVLAIMACVTSFKSVTEEELMSILQVVQLEATQDHLHSIITRLFPILYTKGGSTLRILFPPDIFCEFLSQRQKSGRYYTDMGSVKYRLARYYSHAEPALSLSAYPKIAFERLTEPAKNATRMNSNRGISRIARSPDGSAVVTGTSHGRLEIWDGRTGERIGEPILRQEIAISDIKFSPDGMKLALGSVGSGTVKIWDAEVGRFVLPLESDSDVSAVAYSPDGSRIVSMHEDGRLQIWDTQKKSLIAKSQSGYENCGRTLVYSPDGRTIASGSSNDTVRIWDAESGASLGEPLEGHKEPVTAATYSPDGSRIVTGSGDRTVRIWDAHTRRLVGKPLEGHEGQVIDVGYSQDGRTLFSAATDETVRLWDASNGTPTGVLCRGQSRWDPAKQFFVSIPHWWPQAHLGSLLRVQALIYSANPLYIPDDGWIRTLGGSRLLRVPPEHRARSCHAASEGTITTNPRDERLTRSAWREVSQGWASTKAMAWGGEGSA